MGNMRKVLKVDLVAKIADGLELPKMKVEAVIEALLRETRLSLQFGEVVYLAKFGTFNAKPQASRAARNPRTGENVQTKAGHRVQFKASAGFMDKMAF